MVRIIKLLFIIFYCTWMLASCKKEYSKETPIQIAQGTLSDPAGNCIYDSVKATLRKPVVYVLNSTCFVRWLKAVFCDFFIPEYFTVHLF